MINHLASDARPQDSLWLLPNRIGSFVRYNTVDLPFCLSGGYAQTAERDPLADVFHSLQGLNYDEARRGVKELDQDCLQNNLYQLIDYLEQPERTIRLVVCKTELNEQESFTFQMVRGFSELAKTNYGNSKAFQHFVNAQAISNSLSEKIYEKYALGVILEQLRNQVFLGTNQYESYLVRLEELVDNHHDQVVLELNKTILFSKADDTLGYNEIAYGKSIKRLDSLFRNEKVNSRYLPYYYHEKGIQYKFSDDFQLALDYFRKVDSLTNDKSQYRELRATNFWQLADMMVFAKQIDQAKIYWESSKKNALSLRDTFYDNRLGAKILKGLGEYKESLQLLELSNQNEYEISAKAYSFMSNQLSSKFKEELEVKYNLAQKEKAYLIQKQQAKMSRNWLRFSLLILFIAMGVAALLQRYTSKKRLLAEQDALLKQQRVRNLLKEQELISIDSMIKGQEKERKKVADELHDDLGSLMATIKLHFESIDLDPRTPALRSAKRLLEEAYQKIRGIAHLKNSGVMSDQGLLKAIQGMANAINDTNTIKINVESYGLGDRIENSIELTIFRIIQELLTNVIKHADAHQVNILITKHQSFLNIIIEDDGRGFEYNGLAVNDSAMGLQSIKQKVAFLKGDFKVDSTVGKGTSIIINTPL